MIMPREFAFAVHAFAFPQGRRPGLSPVMVPPSVEDGFHPGFLFRGAFGKPGESDMDFLSGHQVDVSMDSTADVALDLSFKPSTPITPPSTPSPTSPTQTGKGGQETSSRNNPRSGDPVLKKIKIPVRRHKAVRKLDFDEEKTSPVSGTIIRELRDDEPPLVVRKGDIDPAFNLVEVTEEAKAELAKIENKIGDYICRLCKEMYEDAFALAQHRCSRIVHVDYRCPECEKVFNCPANLASHRRWHKPRAAVAKNFSSPAGQAKKSLLEESDGATSDSGDAPFTCHVCRKRFRRQAYLRKHVETHQCPSESSDSYGSSDLSQAILQTGN